MRTLPLAALLALLTLAAVAQRPPRETPVEVTLRTEPATAHPGETIEVIVTATVDAQYHLYAMDQPATEPGDLFGPRPVGITFASEEEIFASAGPWQEPEITAKWDEGFQRDVHTLYGSPLEFRRTFTLSTNLEPGALAIEGSFEYMACTETSCLPPHRLPVSAEIEVQPGAVAAEPLPEAPTPSVATSADEPIAAAPIPTVGGVEEQIGGLSFGGFLLFSFIFGLAALLTPCVFPMIPITISFFTDKQSASKGKAIRLSLTYVLSIIAGFTLIGFGISMILLAAGGGIQSSGFANRLAADPWVNLFFFALYFFFALALFEVFRLSLPSSWANRLESIGRGSETLGIAAKAMVFVVISFTCTAPLLGVLIVQTLTGSWTRPLFGMMAFSAGFALPFFFLALAPQLMGHLPKAGAWMNATKFVMGMLVLAAALKFLSNTDIIWNQEDMILTREILLALWATIGATLALYLFGLIRLPTDGPERAVSIPRLGLGMLFTATALYLAAGLFGSSLHGWVEAYLPPDLSQHSTVATRSGEQGLPESRTATGGEYIASGYSWYRDRDEALAAAREQGRNVFIDFTGYTCTNCRLMERNMFPRPEVADALEDYVRLKLFTDDPETGESHRQWQAEMFNTVALPFYAILTPDGDVLGKAEYTTNVDAYVSFLRRGQT